MPSIPERLKYPMKILVIGSGGREHTLCWKIAQSPKVEKIYCIPGNAGIAEHWETAPVNADNIDNVLSYARAAGIDFTVVGPEAPLVDGIVDRFQEAGLKIFGPNSAAALLEGDKAFAKEIMAENDIPTAEFRVCTDYYSALEAVMERGFPIVIKVAGLAAGKGVFIVKSASEVEQILTAIFKEKKFGHEGNAVVVEKCLHGEEISVFALTDGEDYILLPHSQDHKRIGENDTGPNTGGMGAYAPAPVGTPEVIKSVEDRVIRPLLKAMKKRGTPYRGLLYTGIILTDEGPSVLEFNCRFGDPETQCVLPLVKPDLLELLIATVQDGGIAEWKEAHNGEVISSPDEYAACVILAAEGYPGTYEKGKIITGLNQDFEDSVIFHAGTKIENKEVLTNGGRVLGVTGMGGTLGAALTKAYSAARKIEFEGKYYRRDIGQKALRK